MTSTNNNDRAIAWIAAGLACLCLLLGGVAFAIGWSLRSKALAVSSWPSTDATVTTSRLVSRQYRDRRDNSWRTITEAEIVFRYTVGGRGYEDREVDPTGVGQSGAADVTARYPVGARVRAFYDPGNPSDATLNNTPGGVAHTVLLIVGVLVALLGVPFGNGALRLARRK